MSASTGRHAHAIVSRSTGFHTPDLHVTGLRAAAAACVTAMGLSACGPDTELAQDGGPYEAPAYEQPLTAPDTAVAENEARAAAAQGFVDEAGQFSLMQTSAAEIALETATNPQIQAFAQLMRDQHRASAEALRAAATAAALAPPQSALDQEHLRRVNELAGTETTPDTDFDAQYLAFQEEIHAEAMTAYESYASGGDIAQLRVYADQTLPALRDHLERVREIRASLPLEEAGPAEPG